MSAPRARPAPRLARLTPLDRMYLRSEDLGWPGHFGGLAIVEGEALLDASGRLRLDEIRDRMGRRLARVPALRRRLWVPGILRGGPLWVDDQRFDIAAHVLEVAVDAPGDEGALLGTAARLCTRLLDRRRPLWELWFLTGSRDRRIGVLLKLHHSVADGSAVVGIMGSLFDVEPDAPEPTDVRWVPEPLPDGRTLLADDLARRTGALRRVVATIARPRRLREAARVVALVARRSGGSQRAPRTSLNGPVGPRRRVAYLELDLAAVREVAHAQAGTVNDVVLALLAGGLRQLLLSRGDRVAGLAPIASQAVSTRGTGDGSLGNQVGNAVLPLPVGEADPAGRLAAVVRATRASKAAERPAAVMAVLVALATTPIARYLTLHQQAINVKVTNVVGPRVPMYLLGARVQRVLPITQLIGNVGLSLAAFSYIGGLALVATADADRFPDLDELIEGMRRDWQALTEAGHAAGTARMPLRATARQAQRASTVAAGDVTLIGARR